MLAKELVAWRQEVGITQDRAAEIFGVSRNTVQNWEGGSPIPQTLDGHCKVWGRRLKQEDPRRGPVTLVYSDGPMFVSPTGPRRRTPLLQQEAYLTNSAALGRVMELWDSEGFYNPFILEKDSQVLWNYPELARIADGMDEDAPTPESWRRKAIERLATYVRKYSGTNIVNDGPALPSENEKSARTQHILELAAELDRIAAEEAMIHQTYIAVEEIFVMLRALGRMLPDGLVSDLAFAFVDAEE